MNWKFIIVGIVLALSGLANLFSPNEKRRTQWMDRFGKAGSTLGGAFALFFGIAFLLAGLISGT